MSISLAQKQRAAQYVRGYLMRTAVLYGHNNAETRAIHRWMHTLNVVRNAQKIAESEGVTEDIRFVCELAALFHDIDHYTVDLPYHGIRGAETAAAFLAKEGVPADFVTRVEEAIREHHQDWDEDRPIAEQVDEVRARLSHAAQIVMDAETLDKIGASNIVLSLRSLSTRKDNQVFELARVLTSGFPLQRAQNWTSTLLTSTGRVMGAQRLAFYEQFLRQIGEEIVLYDPYPQPSQQTQEMLSLPK